MDSSQYNILDFIKLPILIIDNQKKILFANREMKKLFPEKVIASGIDCHEILISNTNINQVYQNKKDLLGVTERINNRDYLVDYSPYLDEQGEIAGILMVIHTKQWIEKDWIMAALDAIPDAILLCDETLTVRYINPAYTRLKGLRWEEIVGRKINEVRSGKLIPAVINSGIPINNLYRDIDNVPFIVNIIPIIKENKIIGGISISKDLEQVKEMINSCNHPIVTLKDGKSKNNENGDAFKDIIGESLPLIHTLEKAKIAAKVDSNVLILGESGTGKELIARAIHNGGKRKGGFFVAINCAAIPQNLMESELFGYEGGAFTGATKKAKIGLFELANRGTIFLDEIGEMSLPMQSKLLRVLETKTIRRVGGLQEIPVNVRVIAATNRNLEAMIAQGEFREDLYYRLNVFPIRVPPLRERVNDIPLLARHFIQKLSTSLKKKVTLSEASLNLLLSYDWPGNVRELENALEYAVNMTNSPLIEPEHFPPAILQKQGGLTDQINKDKDNHQLFSLASLEKQAIQAAIKHFGTSTEGKRKAAGALGISLTTLYKKLKDYQIDL
ncbi:sigma 54-interacting transcriptional regulator [Desulfofundulus sp. TPOSR]|uniref:PAS modulated sigma54 specific transcriptional regulator, Fis family n=1 Tax=Desulfofundulus kuznetsovii (strain DSM 6115 / VKM B-1805 / 17) TaxID=760568 RepID=A0AAU8PF51_DESK7|nr:sigma 54-interacting transcriptional regulator [Desulfofundulus sp. TPOSR]AEG16726.1 PAS modulated sigma54 specific transcriptional regulator, Fis family [Desulfofundulus kuznetsovii DSM 6115]NHM28754.1 sigma 54-interacting transcriptional regulator [Desulfofundulus sp. TPOSR]